MEKFLKELSLKNINTQQKTQKNKGRLMRSGGKVIEVFQWGGPFNAISMGQVKVPPTKKALKQVGKVLTLPLMPLAALQGCSSNNCWHNMNDLSSDYNNPSAPFYPFQESPAPIEKNPDGGYIYHGKTVTYKPGEKYNGEAAEGFVTVLPPSGGEEQIATIDFNRYYDKPDSIWHVTQGLTNEEYNKLLKKYPQYKDPNTIGKVLNLTDFYNALK